jgi:hypothetical protein
MAAGGPGPLGAQISTGCPRKVIPVCVGSPHRWVHQQYRVGMILLQGIDHRMRASVETSRAASVDSARGNGRIRWSRDITVGDQKTDHDRDMHKIGWKGTILELLNDQLL